jgi:hypothetical protein
MSEESDSELLDSLIERLQEGTAGHLDRQMQAAQEIKAQEEKASRRRLEEMWMREHERQLAIARSKAEQQRQEQMLVRGVLIAGAIFILIVILISVGLRLAGGEPRPESLLPAFRAYV